MAEKPNLWIDRQANSPFPIWGMSALSFATLPLSVKGAPGMPSVLQSLAFGGIFAGAGYVSHTGDVDNGAGIATAWCLSWAFLNAKSAILSKRPVPLFMVAAVTANTVIYGKKYLQVNGYLAK
ncbi:altered inheritance of mitochondria protein 19 [Spinellus fusiger]|nr:altered inheritance of mitochondria protein 19 [Spinellus fusiger]